MSNHENACISQEEIDRTARINMEVCATFVARMIQKYGHEVLAEIEDILDPDTKDEQSLSNRKGGYDEKEKMLYIHQSIRDGSDRWLQFGSTSRKAP